MKKKRLISLLLCIAMIFSAFPVGVFAVDVPGSQPSVSKVSVTTSAAGVMSVVIQPNNNMVLDNVTAIVVSKYVVDNDLLDTPDKEWGAVPVTDPDTGFYGSVDAQAVTDTITPGTADPITFTATIPEVGSEVAGAYPYGYRDQAQEVQIFIRSNREGNLVPFKLSLPQGGLLPVADPTVTSATNTEVTKTAYEVKDYGFDTLANLLPQTVLCTLSDSTTKKVNVGWAHTSGTYNPKGTTYTYEGTFTTTSGVDLTGAPKATATLEVTPITAGLPTLTDMEVTVGTKADASATDLSLPTSGDVSVSGETIPYTIAWGSEILDTTGVGNNQTFAGTLSYTTPPNWMTEPASKAVSQKVTVIAKQVATLTVGNTTAVYGSVLGDPTVTIDGGLTGTTEFTYTGTSADGTEVLTNSVAKPTKVGTFTINAKFSNDTHEGTATGTATITQKELVITWGTPTFADMTYKGKADVTVSDPTGTPTLSDSATPAVTYKRANANAGNSVAVIAEITGFTGATGGDANYKLPTAATNNSFGTVKVDPIALTIAAGSATVNAKEYNGDNVATINGTPTLTGVVADDTCTAKFKNATYEDVNAGATKTVTANYELDGAEKDNYTLTPGVVTWTGQTVSKATPTITVDPTLVGTPAAQGAALSTINFNNATGTVTGVGSTTLTGGTYAWETPATVLNATAAQSYHYVPSAADQVNYDNSAVKTVSVTVNAPSYTITTKTVPTFANIKYGAAQPAAKDVVFTNDGNVSQGITATLTGADADKFVLTGGQQTVAAGADATYQIQPIVSLDVGTYTVAVKATSADNTAGATTTDITFTVDKAQLPATTLVATKAYNGNDTLAFDDITTTPKTLNGVKGETLTLTGITGAKFKQADVYASEAITTKGTITAAGDTGKASNYDLTDLTNLTINGSITAAPIDGTVAITGSTSVDDELTANVTSINPTGAQAGLTYQWKADGANITSATNSTYTLTAAEVGKKITVEVTGSGNYKDSKTSAETAAVTNKTIGGTVTIKDDNGGSSIAVGDVLSVVLTGVTPTDAQSSTYTYAWTDGAGKSLTDGTGATYTVKSGDSKIKVAITVDSADTKYTGSLTSAEVEAGKETIASVTVPTSNNGTVWGSQLTVGTITPSGAQTQVDYQWKADGTNISGATSSSYTTTLADFGKSITVEVTAKSGTAYTGSALSLAFGPMTAKPQAAPGVPTIKDGPYYDKVVANTVVGQEYLINDANDTTTGSPTWVKATGTTHEFTGLTAGTPYYVFTRLAAKNGYDASTASSSATQTTKTLAVPGAPTNLAASGNGQLVVTWKAPADNGGSPITEYTVQLDATPAVDVGTNLTHTFTGLTNGTEYNITVTATNAQGTSANATLKATPKAGGGGGGGGSSTSSYTVSYDVGKYGTLVGNKTESVTKNEYPAKVPTVKANEGYQFLGWSLDGKTVIDPTKEKITAANTFKAVYREVNENDHLLYIKGMGGGIFAPNGSMTRAEAVTMLDRLHKGFEDKAYENKFNDVNSSNWFFNYVTYAANNGIAEGYEDGSFKPQGQITRAEFAAMICRFAGISPVETDSKLSDVKGHWAAGYITALTDKGIITGYEDGTFRPDQTITRAEAVKIINGAVGRTPDKAKVEANLQYYTNQFTDVTTSHWAYYEIIEASMDHFSGDFHVTK